MGANGPDLTERRRMIAKLFSLFGESDRARADLYVEMTRHIPRSLLAYALRSVVESHVWSKLPTVGEVVQAAKAVAGMDREQYRDGRYLPAPREWPPDGKRHAIGAGELEPLRVCLDVKRLLPEPERLALPERAA